MSSNKNVISAIITDEQRASILGAAPAEFPNVFALVFTWEYGVRNDAPFQIGGLQLTLDRVQTDPIRGVQIALGHITDGTTTWHRRPDGRPVHVTISTKQGVPPSEGGLLLPTDGTTTPIDPVTFTTFLNMRHATKLHPTPRERLAPAT